jgi:hypothetical protein
MKINLTRSAVVAFAVLVVVLAMAVPSHASNTDIVYTNRTIFNAQVSGQSTIDFAGPTTQYTSPQTISGVKFTGLNGRDVEIIDGTNLGLGASEFALTTYCQVSGPSCNTNIAQDSLMLTLPAGTQAIGFDIADANSGAPAGTQDIYKITDSNGSVITSTLTNFGGFSFVGFGVGPGNTSITSVTITRLTVTPNGEAVIDNVSFSPNAPTPEPSTLSLAGAGLFAAGSALRRRLGRGKK